MKKSKQPFLLSNTRNIQYAIAPTLQNWIVENIAPKLKEANLEKQAIILPEGIFEKVSMEQTVNDSNKDNRKELSRLFTSEEEAKAWLVDS